LLLRLAVLGGRAPECGEAVHGDRLGHRLVLHPARRRVLLRGHRPRDAARVRPPHGPQASAGLRDLLRGQVPGDQGRRAQGQVHAHPHLLPGAEHAPRLRRQGPARPGAARLSTSSKTEPGRSGPGRSSGASPTTPSRPPPPTSRLPSRRTPATSLPPPSSPGPTAPSPSPTGTCSTPTSQGSSPTSASSTSTP